MRQPSDLRLFHLHRAQFDAGFDGDAADVGNDAAAVFERAARESLERLARRRHGLVHVAEQAETALIPAARGQPVPVGSRGRPAVAAGPQAGDHLFHDASHQCFINLHGKTFSPPCGRRLKPSRRPAGGG